MLTEIPPNHRRQTLFRLPHPEASLAEAALSGQLRYIGTVDTLNGHGTALRDGISGEYLLIDIGEACAYRGGHPDDTTPLGELIGHPDLDAVLSGEDKTYLVRVTPGSSEDLATRALGCVVLTRTHFTSVFKGNEALELQPREITGLLVTVLALAGEAEIEPSEVIAEISALPRR